MTVSKLSNGSYQARFQWDGKRYKKNFPKAAQARAWEADTLRKLAAGETVIRTKDARQLSDLAQLWYDLHGHTLKDGARRLNRLNYCATEMGNPEAHKVTPSFYLTYRKARIDAGSTENNENRMLTYWKAVFNELRRLEHWQQENPLRNVKPLSFDETEMGFLTSDEIARLLHECENSKSTDLPHVVRLCLATGARWNEAAQLDRSHIQMMQGRARVIYQGTKSGKVRRIPIAVELAQELLGAGKPSGRLFGDCLSAFRRAVERAGIELPDGQLTHALRHTFASHFMMNGGDILQLKEILGHSTLTMTIRYAHLAPDALEQAIRFNPLATT
ncbi:Site-specific recombinase XerD [Thalassolituus maritimus]|uniref:Site-specific recombinase XerD n=1 Tax=Thalassolituus maritimus TaxID=484498 RepID=A0A1N7NIU4_9GAMM|nr:tyrosine-type recombinase/integrase [Thalassolituus maritimus]SIS98181.1 Site-specific recombinase XerD [Thalassolituus maritimus]